MDKPFCSSPDPKDPRKNRRRIGTPKKIILFNFLAMK
jgi:hypothetical protein